MPWFLVDDHWHADPGAVRAGLAAVGLWTVAGSWSCQQLTDGWIPHYIASRLDPDYAEHAHALVRAGIWVEDEVDGDKGWQYVDWEKQPMREREMEKRAAAKERMRSVRENRRNGSQDVRANRSRTSGEVRRKFAQPDTDTYTDNQEQKNSSSELRPDVEALCEHLAKWVVKNGSKQPKIGKAWRDAARRLMDLDGRTFDQIMRAIDWCQKSKFWRANIRSMPTLREKYDQIRLQAIAEQEAAAAPAKSTTDDRVRGWGDVAAAFLDDPEHPDEGGA